MIGIEPVVCKWRCCSNNAWFIASLAIIPAEEEGERRLACCGGTAPLSWARSAIFLKKSVLTIVDLVSSSEAPDEPIEVAGLVSIVSE